MEIQTDMTNPSTIIPSDQRPESYRDRQRLQIIRFFTGTALTLLCSRQIHRTMNTLRYKPKMFHSNHNPPGQIYQGEATKALVLSSGISVGIFSMFIFGGCWIWDISTLDEFTTGMRKTFNVNRGSNKLNEDTLDDDNDSGFMDEINKIMNEKE